MFSDMRGMMRFVGGAALGLPLVVIFAGCRFDLPDLPDQTAHFNRGDPPHTAAIFCNIEFGRRCATPTEKQMGVPLGQQYEEGFWKGKSSVWGLDYSPAALAECNGEPQTIVFRGAFPDGNAICLNDKQFDLGKYTSVKAACEAWCDSHEWIDSDGSPYSCANVAWPAASAWQTPVVNACTGAGTLRPEFQDLRRMKPEAVTWMSVFNVMITGNSIRRTNAGTLPNSGAVSTGRLPAGHDGYIDFVAVETNKSRLCGLAIGANDNNQQPSDIDFAIHLGADGTFTIRESNIAQTAPVPYGTLDRFRVAVIGGVVQYFRNDVLVITSSKPVGYPMRVDTSLLEQNATITDVQISFP
jgi:hypothetical protein